MSRYSQVFLFSVALALRKAYLLAERLDSNISVLCCIASLAFSFVLIVCIALYSCCCKGV